MMETKDKMYGDPGGARTPATSGKSLKTRKRAESASSKSTKSNTSAKKNVRVPYVECPLDPDLSSLHEEWWRFSGETSTKCFPGGTKSISRIGFRAGYRAAVAALKGGAK